MLYRIAQGAKVGTAVLDLPSTEWSNCSQSSLLELSTAFSLHKRF